MSILWLGNPLNMKKNSGIYSLLRSSMPWTCLGKKLSHLSTRGSLSCWGGQPSEISKADPSHILWWQKKGLCWKKAAASVLHQWKTLQKEDRYPIKEIQVFSGTDKKICASLNLQIKPLSKVSFWQGKSILHLSCVLINEAFYFRE